MKPRIAFLVGNFPAISATFIVNQIKDFIDQGWDVRIFALRDPRESRVHEDVLKYGLADKTTYFAIPLSRLRRTAGVAGYLRRNLFRYPRRVLKSISPWFFPGETLRLNTPYYLEPFLDARPDVLFCHFGPNGLLGALLKGLGVPGRLVTVFHGYDLSSFLRGRSASVYRNLFSRGDLFLPVSLFWKDRLMKMGCPENRIRVQHMGVDLGRFAPESVPGVPGTLEILTVGRLVKKKGHAVALRALRDFAPRRDWRYTIAGDGPLRGELEDLAAACGLGGRVRFTGPVRENEVLSLYRQAHVFLLPSMTGPDGDCEGIPMVLMEAMAMQLPVVTTRHSGIPELVEHRRSGFLAAENNPDALREGLDELARDGNLRRSMGEAGRQKVMRDFNLEVQNARLRRRVLELLEGENDNENGLGEKT